MGLGAQGQRGKEPKPISLCRKHLAQPNLSTFIALLVITTIFDYYGNWPKTSFH